MVPSRYQVLFQECCETGTAIGTFFLGTGTAKHSGSGFGSGTNIKWNTEVKNVRNEMTTFWETMPLLKFKRQDFVHIFATNLIWSGSGTGPAINSSGSAAVVQIKRQ